ncbi:hypothetical protein CAPTEDRAFT_186393, partial [Capitella teleta]
MPQCAVWDCNSFPGQSSEDGSRLSFHTFPLKNASRLKAWVHACGRQNFTPTKFCHTVHPRGMKARLMLAAPSWNALQRSNATEKVDVVKWSKRKGAWVLEERRKKQASDSVPPQLKSLMSRVVE